MKLARFMSKYSTLGSVGFLVLSVLLFVGASMKTNSLLLLSALISFGLVFVFAFGGFYLYSFRNAALRRRGKAAIATVLAEKMTGITAGSGLQVRRIKLEVHPPDEAPFVAVAEDAYELVFEGDQLAVRYDPVTKEVAIEKGKKPKEEDF